MVAGVAIAMGVFLASHCYFRRENMIKAEEALVSMCEERARMIQDQFAVSVNHVHALGILISTFYYQKQPPALDQVGQIERLCHYSFPFFFLSKSSCVSLVG